LYFFEELKASLYVSVDFQRPLPTALSSYSSYYINKIKREAADKGQKKQKKTNAFEQRVESRFGVIWYILPYIPFFILFIHRIPSLTNAFMQNF
jgi:hypothetical protein